MSSCYNLVMKLSLKGITGFETLNACAVLDISCLCFDLRPKSFNFTTQENILKLVESLRSDIGVRLLFEDEAALSVKELSSKIKKSLLHDHLLMPEFTGQTLLSQLELLDMNYVWNYHDKERLSELQKAKNLKVIVLHHSDLEYLHSQNELFGFLNLLKESIRPDQSFELQLEWECNLIESIFSYFDFQGLIFEITNKVEVSYQNVDVNLMKELILEQKNLFI